MPTSSTRKPAAPKTAGKKAVSKASNFKKNKSIDLELPSGEVCLVRRPGMDILMAEGVFSDSLLPLVQESMDKARSGGSKTPAPEIDTSELLKDPKKMSDIMDSYDKVVVLVVREPAVAWHKREAGMNSEGKPHFETIPESERDDEIVYTDDIDLNDKMFIFQFVVGGSSDLASFREQLGQGVAAVSDGEVV